MATAADGDQAWFLWCEIREKLVDSIQKTLSQSLPRRRAGVRGLVPAKP